MATTILNGCPRCNGAVDLTNQDPTCFTCGWTDYTYAEEHQDRRRGKKVDRPRSIRSTLPYYGLRPRRGRETLDIVLKEGRLNETPICYECETPMVPTWIPGTKANEKGFSCHVGHTVRLHRNERGEMVAWS